MPLTELPNRAPPDLVTNGRNWEWLRNLRVVAGDLNLTSAHLLVGNASGVATDTAVTGDVTINNTGVTAIGAGVIVDADVNAAAAIAASKLDPKLVNSTVENLKVIRGAINTAGSGSITSGVGFTIARNGAGDVTITFTAAFATAPTVTATPLSGGVAPICALSGAPGTGSARVLVLNAATNTGVDDTFHFTAIGPR